MSSLIIKNLSEPLPFRAHHWFCLPGYEGHSYTNVHKNNWDYFSKYFLEKPETKVKIVRGEDILCLDCPNSATQKATCKKHYVSNLDKIAMNFLSLVEGGIYVYGEQLARLRAKLTPQKHAEICGDCKWRTFGLCKDTFKKVSSDK